VKMKTRFAQGFLSAVRVLAASLACVGAAAGSPPAAVQAEAFEEALDLYAQGKWSAAYGYFARLADDGHAQAATIAILMSRYGGSLYGYEWGASQAQIDHWIELSCRRMEALRANVDASSRQALNDAVLDLVTAK
jgi:hypothetical protein